MTNATVNLAMSELLERAGFRLRGKTRADCVHCAGTSIATVSFTDELAYCHRCAWKANATTLAKELGLIATDPESRRLRREEARRLAEYRETIARFEAWRDGHIRAYSAKLRALGHGAALAKEVLAKYPDCDPAWDCFAKFCHEEGELNQILDYLCFTKCSPWLDEDSTPLGLFEAWRREIDGKA
jgi:hypothetical protein